MNATTYTVELFTISGIRTKRFKSLQKALTFTHSKMAAPHRHISLFTINHKGKEVFHFAPAATARAYA
jgi:hypothetical protein